VSFRAWAERLKRRCLDEEDFQDEIRAHLAMAAAEKMADGTDRSDAHYAALREFGNVTRMTETARRIWTPRWLELARESVNDARYAVRTLAKHPAFSLTVIGVLTLGIGLNAAVFTMLKGFALSPIAGVEGSGRLAIIYGETSAGRKVRLSYPDYQYLRDHDTAFSGLFGSIVATVNLGRGRAARQAWGEIVTGNYFQLLGVRAQLGRTLLPSDEIAPGGPPIVVISDGLWRRDFAAAADIIGKTIIVNARPLTVVGVADSTFHGTIVSYDVELFIPVMMAPSLGYKFASQQGTPSAVLGDRAAAVFFPHGYLQPGRTLSNATHQTNALWDALSADRSPAETAQRLHVVRFRETPSSAPTFMLPTLSVLIAMGLLVLLIACANIAGLVLVRGVSRRGEMAVRLALGATKTRIVRLLVIENLVLAIPGALLGVLLAANSIPVLVHYAERLAAPDRIFFNIETDGLVIAFAVTVACGSALVFGFMPALQSARVDLVSVINEDASPRGASRSRFRSSLVIAQVAVSLLLLVGASLTARSVQAARRANPGFDAAHVASIGLDVEQNGYDRARGGVFYRKLLDQVRAVPGIESATLAAYHPLTLLDTRAQRIAIDGYVPQPNEDLAFLSNTIAPDYFQTLRIRMVAGRDFTDDDDDTSEPVAIVNSTMARRFWDGAAEAIGKRIRTADGHWRTIVGVVADVKYARINEAPRPYFYVPFLQSYRSGMILHSQSASTSVDRVIAQTRTAVEAIDPDLPVMYATSLAEFIDGALIFFDLSATLLFVFGTTGMVLAALGTYGLVSYTVKQGTHEIGIRIALGATALSVVRQFLARGLRLGAAGALFGVVAALGLGRILESALFGVAATDAVSFARALAIVLVGVIVATLVPAWRAARTDALSALRHP
jgi:predicted permease